MSNDSNLLIKIPPWKYAFCGGLSGITSRTLTAPIETVKLRYQVEGDIVGRPGIFSTCQEIYVRHGFRGFFYGNGVNIIRVAPAEAIRFTIFEYTKHKILNRRKQGATDSNSLSRKEHFFAGSLAGLFSTFICYPLDTVRSQLTTQRIHVDVLHVIKRIFVTTGIPGFFRGVTISTVGSTPYYAFNFMFYHHFKDSLTNPVVKLPAEVIHFLSGGFAGAFAMTICYPTELLSRRMMVNGVPCLPVRPLSVYAGATAIWQSGFSGFYHGIWPNYVKVFPTMGIGFAAYEACKQALGIP